MKVRQPTWASELLLLFCSPRHMLYLVQFPGGGWGGFGLLGLAFPYLTVNVVICGSWWEIRSSGDHYSCLQHLLLIFEVGPVRPSLIELLWEGLSPSSSNFSLGSSPGSQTVLSRLLQKRSFFSTPGMSGILFLCQMLDLGLPRSPPKPQTPMVPSSCFHSKFLETSETSCLPSLHALTVLDLPVNGMVLLYWNFC